MNPIIIIPTYNESENIREMIPLIFDRIFAKQNISILVADDNSPDKTALIVEEYQKKYPNLHLIKREGKLGLASAYITGIKYAIEKGYDAFIEFDADFQHPPEVIPELIEKSSDYDVVIASRYLHNKNCKYPFNLKTLISVLGNLYIHAILWCGIKDLSGGFTLWTKKAIETINLDSIISQGYMFQIEMKYKAFKKGLKIYEHPFCFETRKSGESKMDGKILTEVIKNIWKIR